ncbi:MAG: S8 family peptidase [Lewinellaceae bacterium]|nr:S8 family peptidase [Saprospiraceae bacterium]MCB9340471.1 S8 family peptidase [Lewinellaceae bacterium]
MPENINPLIFLTEPPLRKAYTSPQSGGGKVRLPFRNRASHSQRLIQSLTDAFSAASSEITERLAIAKPSREGIYIVFESHPGLELITKSLEAARSGIRLLNVSERQVNGKIIKTATVYIPKGKEPYFINKLEQYAKEDIVNDKGESKPKNDQLVRSIENIKLAVVESFWQSNLDLMPNDGVVWCEAWLRVEEKANIDDILEAFDKVCQSLKIQVKGNQLLRFPERAVVLIEANKEQLGELVASTDYLAELRRAQETARFWMNLKPFEQAEWVQELLGRMQVKASDVSICILDTGINNGHPLIQPVLDDRDCHTYLSDWRVNDHDGHGTLMAGLATFFDLEKHLAHSLPVIIEHRLESVKVLPPTGANDPDLYGDITKQAVSLAEIQSPERRRVVAMAVGSTIDTGTGKPSSWSGAVDQLAFGTDEEQVKRLVLVSAGNTDESELNKYPDATQSTSVESPGQSWNALTVGAFTEKTQLTNPSFSNWTVLAPIGGISPFSTTSLIWDNKWPVKPDVVFEGGNAMVDEYNFASECDDLSLLSTHYQPQAQSFFTFNKTSAATAQASWFAAQIMKSYPDAWPETVRALMVHSAEWTDAMKSQFHSDKKGKNYREILRTCGYGTPNLQKATSCLDNSLTLVAQERIQPFRKKESRYVTNEMHLYQLPWPTDVLRGLGEMQVVLRITLSYFIDPSPGEIGWKDKYRYPSHGLRFDMNTPREDSDSFIRRINAAIQAEEDSFRESSANVSGRWMLGTQNRNLGSIHSDFWEGTAADLAESNLVAIYPTVGWWRERHHLGKWDSWTRYSLIISLETADQTVPIYETVVSLISTKVSVQVS